MRIPHHPDALGIPGAYVTHIWTQDPGDAKRVAETTFIPHVLSGPEEAGGKVDAVVITTDIGSTHLELARPFLERDIPVFVDKPLTDNEDDLRAFIRYFREGKPLLSSSSIRYAKEIEELNRERLGWVLFVSAMMTKSWERYGVHALEGLYMIMGGGIESVQNLGTEDVNVVHIRYKDGRQAVVNVVYPYPPDETVELARAVIAGILSRQRGGERMYIGEIAP